MRGYGKRTLALSIAVGLIGLIGLVGPSSASAATQIGQTFAPPDLCGGPTTFLQSASPGGQYTVPAPGVITSWSFQAGADPPDIRLKLARPAVAADTFTIVGESPVKSPAASQFHTYTDVRISVQPGDVIGFAIVADGECIDTPVAGYNEHVASGDRPTGDTMTYTPFSGYQLEIAASLEPDADNDGFGDETQDQCPTSAATQNECVPPDTTITKKPKDKTKKKTATFEFTSSEPGSTFQCTLDGQTNFKTCASPLTVKVKKGKHTFQVQAIDQAGNADGSLATDDWKVKKKKRK